MTTPISIFRHTSSKEIRLKDYTPRRIRKRRKKAHIKKRIAAEKAALRKKRIKDSKLSMKNLRLVRLLLHLIRDIYRPIISAIRIRVDRLFVSVGTEDAAKTAILYGVAAQGAAYILALLDSFTKTRINNEETAVIADFTATKTVTDIKIRILISPLRIIGLYIKALWLLIKEEASIEEKNTKNGERKDERKQSK